MKQFIRQACLILLLLPMPAAAGDFSAIDPVIDPAIASMIGGADAVAVSSPGKGLVYAKNADLMRIPASTLKILTALVAFEHLGENYRFPTDFYIDTENNLIVKGYGDPFLVSENMATIAAHIADRIGAVNDLVMDGSYFADSAMPGTAASSIRSYDAPVGALCANFNTVFFKTEKGRLVSAEPQTPLLPLARKRIRTMGLSEGRVMLSSDGRETTRYAGALLRHFLAASGVEVNGDIRVERADVQHLTPVHRHYSERDVSEMVSQMMAYSNNFVANQLLLAAGAKAYGAPATLEKGVRAARAYADGLGISPKIVEGSGISRNNRITAKMMIAILDDFANHYALLQKRDRIYFKTGTLSDVQTRAGYIEGKDGILYRFVVMLNTRGKLAAPVVDRIADNL